MKAIILTYDDRMPLAELTIQSYLKHWPGNNFTFRVPFNGSSPNTTFKYGNKVEFIKSEKCIKSTILSLFEGIDDDDFVYWCFDDCYLHDILHRKSLNGIYNYINNNNVKDIDSFRLLKFYDEQEIGKSIDINSMKFYLKEWHPYRFWFHQFIRASVIKNAFLDNDLPNDVPISKIEIKRVSNVKHKHNVYIPSNDLCVLGETSRGNRLTKNCVQMLNQYKLPIPDFEKLSAVVLNGADVNNSGISSSVKFKDYLKRYL